MQGSDYIFCFQDSANNFWRIESDGMVSLSSQPYFLDFAPKGWEDVGIKNVRNKKYWGIDRTVTVPLSYVNDGAKILKHIVYNLGIETNVYLVIASQKLDYQAGVNYGYWYKQIYRGEINLSEFNHSGAVVTCTAVEDGLAKYLKSNENTTIELDMNVPEAINIKMDGIKLHESLNYKEVPDLEVSRQAIGLGFRMPSSFISSEGDNINIQIEGQTLQSVSSINFTNPNILLKNVGIVPVDMVIEGVLELVCTGMVSSPAYSFRARFGRSGQNIGNQDDYALPSTGAMTVGTTYTIPVNKIVPLAANESLFYQGIFFGGPGTDAKIKFTENSKLKIKFITRYETTYIKGFRGQYLFEKLISSTTDMKFSAELSAYLELYKQKVFTCGNSIRGLLSPKMKISLTDIFQDYDSFDSVGLIENGSKVDIMARPDMVDVNTFIDLPEPASDSFKVSIAKEFLYNELEIGYPEIKNDVGVLNGNDEFNTKFLFGIGTTKSPAKMDKVSKIKTSPYEIEKIRVTTFNKNTTDYKDDNDLFSIYIEDTLHPASGIIPAHYLLDRSLNTGATGLIEPETVFNLQLSPKRNLKRNGRWLKSSLYKADAKILQFKTSDKNDKLISGGLVEKADEPIADLGDKFFEPVIFTGNFPAPENLLDLLDLNPLQVFRFTFYGDYYKGILIEASISQSNRKEQQYILLSCAGNDLTKLIDYYGG